MKAYFRNDYSETCHPQVLEALAKLGQERFTGYGEDRLTQAAEHYIRKLIAQPQAHVYFLAGGTVTNVVAISSILRPHEAVISVDTGHINVHETGAVEASGHKILTVPHQDGKILPEQIEKMVRAHHDPAQVIPKMVYISNVTEVGTIYRKAELEAISAVCRKLGLYLFIDGARLAGAMASEKNDLDIREMAALCDLFYIGGTKQGCLFGEALVLVNAKLADAFPWLIKNRAALLAKGFVTAAQMHRLLQLKERAEDADSLSRTLYFSLGEKANREALNLAAIFEKSGFPVEFQVEANLVFVRLPETIRKRLDEGGIIYECETENLCRFVTTYSTGKEEIEEVEGLLR